MTVDIPGTADDITPEWLNSVLDEVGPSWPSGRGATGVTGCSTSLAATQGTTSTLVRIAVVFDSPDSGLPTDFVAKLRPVSDEVFARCSRMGLYSREVGFYRDIPSPGLSVPACYYAAEDETGNFVLLLEDLGSQRAFQGGADVERALQQIAGFHAKWWGSSELDRFDWCNAESTRTLLEERIEELRDHVERFVSGETRKMVPPRINAFLQAWVDNYHLLFDFQPRSPLTLTHGDFWPGQLFFPEDESRDLRVVDWQSVRPSAAAVDVSRIVSDGLAVGMSTTLEPPLIESYLETLIRHGVQRFPRADFEMDYCLQLGGVLEAWVSHTVGLTESERVGFSVMQPYFDSLVWSFDSHRAIERVHEYLQW